MATEQLTIRRTTAEDLPAVMDFYTNMIDEMQGTDFDIMWKHDKHPSHAFIRESVEKGYAIIGITEDGQLVTSLIIDFDAAPGYEKVPWDVPGPADKVGIMHAVATRPAYHGRGFAKQLVNKSVELSREAGLKSIHLDTLLTNDRAHGLYPACGFKLHGAYDIFYEDLGTIALDMFEYVL